VLDLAFWVLYVAGVITMGEGVARVYDWDCWSATAGLVLSSSEEAGFSGSQWEGLGRLQGWLIGTWVGGSPAGWPAQWSGQRSGVISTLNVSPLITSL
jgi:hypothetical protein